MTNHAVITGTYSDLKFIKGRSVVQIVVEVPIEAGEQIVAAFGTPQPGNEIPVAIARLQEGSKKAENAQSECLQEPERKPMSRAQMAGILCNDPVFWAFLREQPEIGELHIYSEREATENIRAVCQVRSRAELDTNRASGATWDNIYDAFRTWKAMERCGVGQ